MKRKLAIVFSAVLMLFFPFEGKCGFGWDTAINEDLYNQMLSYIKTIESESIGTPYYGIVQEMLIDVKAIHKQQPYAWLGQVHRICTVLEDIYGPAMGHPTASSDAYEKLRRNIFRLRDFPMHEVAATNDEKPATQQQVDAFDEAVSQEVWQKRDQFLAMLYNGRPAKGEVQIMKLYSAGFIVRTSDVCLGIDLSWNWGLYNSERKDELVNFVDAYFTSHAHEDHYDEWLLNAAAKKGKPMFMTVDLAPGVASDKKIIWNEMHTDEYTIKVNNTDIKVTAGYGAQDDEPCLMMMIEVDGVRITHLGDNNLHEKEAEFYPLVNQADIVLCPIFNGLPTVFNSTYAKAPNPDGIQQLYINCHENEHVHGVASRVSMKYFYETALNDSAPVTVILDNGECITIKK